MKYNEEIREIRKMLNEGVAYNDNYAHKRTDEELQDYVSYISKKDSGLSCDIIIDSGGENYKYYNHPLCLYIVGEGDDVYPVTISENPTSPTGTEIPGDVFLFIKSSIAELQAVADNTISGGDFFDYMANYKQNKENMPMVGEMATFRPNETGLSVFVYVDDTGAYLKSGHNGSYRIKFQQDTSLKNARLWMPMLIPSLEVMNNGKLPPIKISQKEIKDIRIWAEKNTDLLLQLKDNIITGTEFKNNMLSMVDIKVLLDSEINK